MIDPVVLPGFLVACLVVCVVPGPDHAYISAVAVQHGRRAGVLASFSMAAGMVIHLGVTALGLGALLRAAPGAIDWIRVLGAAYLVHLAVAAVRDARRAEDAGAAATPGSSVVRRSLLVNLTNPKMILFMVAFLPQFTRTSVGPAWIQLVTLGLILIAVGLTVDSTVAVLVGTVAERTAATSGARIGYAAATVYLVLAGFLIYETLHR